MECNRDMCPNRPVCKEYLIFVVRLVVSTELQLHSFRGSVPRVAPKRGQRAALCLTTCNDGFNSLSIALNLETDAV